MAVSSIQVSMESKKLWNALKNHPSESFEKMFNRILKIVYDEEELLTKEDLADIKKSMSDFEKGRFTSNKDLRKEF